MIIILYLNKIILLNFFIIKKTFPPFLFVLRFLDIFFLKPKSSYQLQRNSKFIKSKAIL